MRVVLIAHANEGVKQPFAGGLESMCWHLVQGLRERGIDVELYAGQGSDPDLRAHELPIHPFVLSADARADVAMPPERVVSEHFAYLDLMLSLEARSDVDIVHNNCLHYLPLAMASLLPSPMVTTLHTPPTPWLEPAARGLDDARARYVAVSEETRRAWSPIVAARTIHNGVDTRRWTLGPGGDSLVWFGRIVPEKAPHRAIAIARAAGLRLTIAGPVWDRGYFDEAIAPQLGDGVEYAGHLTTAELNEVVGRSAACLVTSAWEEPFGLVAAEAMATGTPAVVFDRGGLPEVVARGGGAVVPEGDEAAAVDALRAVRRLDRRRVRDLCVRRFSLSRMVDDYVALFLEVCERGAA
ncbi:glycosyltransferase [Nigerium massiliense]|uniref:glycosyltransferase n=1 Tax=Nigerium massiliense TaxID=1522317 RepID=UPI00058FB4EB|nr:glycosyltransferase [Nigerium massiliense]